MINLVKESKEKEDSSGIANLKWKEGWEQKQGKRGPFFVVSDIDEINPEEKKILQNLPEKEKHSESHEGWTYYVTKFNDTYGVMKFPQRKGGAARPQYVRKMESVIVLQQEGLISLLKNQTEKDIFDNLVITNDGKYVICKYKMVNVDSLVNSSDSKKEEDKQ